VKALKKLALRVLLCGGPLVYLIAETAGYKKP
jgi:hypothetical protein